MPEAIRKTAPHVLRKTAPLSGGAALLFSVLHGDVIPARGDAFVCGTDDLVPVQQFLDAVRRNAPAPIDVYDAAAWMSITCLSEQSVALGGMPMPIPDFTNGKWLRREPWQP